MGRSVSPVEFYPSQETRWLPVAISDQVGWMVTLPRVGYLREILWLTAVQDRVVRRSEKFNPPKLLQVTEADVTVAMEPGELWICISDVLPGDVAAKEAVNENVSQGRS